jgi:hypothetical protein
MHPPKKPPASTSDLLNKSRNERQKALLLCEVVRLHCTRSSDGLRNDSRKLMQQIDDLCHDSRDLRRQSRARRNS